MNDLSVRIDYNKRLAKGFAPAAQPLVNDEPQAQAPNVKAKDAAPGNRPVINKETVNYLRALKIAASMQGEFYKIPTSTCPSVPLSIM